jgi:thiosulfate reductase cytochrome b subunit
MAATVTSKNTTIESVSPKKIVYAKHHILVRLSHWLNIVVLLGLGMTGLSIYWASPVYQHGSDPDNLQDYLQDFGTWLTKHIPGQAKYDDPPSFFYNHISLGTGMLSSALRLHWMFAYIFMGIGVIYLIGLFVGKGYKALIPRKSDIKGTYEMITYYVGIPFALIAKKPWPHPQVSSKYNSLQRMAYLSMPILGTLAVASGWAIHKPQQLGWLQGLFGGYDNARVWHFWIMWVFASFVIPHVILVIADGWDTFRSMVTGWSERTWEKENG